MSKLIPKHQTPSQPLVLSQDNTRVESPYIESIPITETNLYKQYLADPYKNSDFNTWKKRQELIQSNRKDEKVKADNRSSKVKEQETKQGEARHNQQQRKELEAKVNRGIWTGIGLGGLALAQATPTAPFIDAAFATHGALGLAKQYDKGTLGLNLETGLHALEMLPFGIRGVGKAVKYADDVAREAYAPYDFYRTIQETTPNIKGIPYNVGWGPKQTIKVVHATDSQEPLQLFFNKRWDVTTEGANPFGVWYQGKWGQPRTAVTNSLPGKAEKAAKARKLFENRKYKHQGEVTLDKPLTTIGDVPNRSALSYDAEKMGADGIIYNNVYDNGFDNNQVIHSFKTHNNNKPITIEPAYIKDSFGKEIVLTPYPGTDTQLQGIVDDTWQQILFDYFRNPKKIEQIKQTMGWGDAEIAQLQNEILRSIGSNINIKISGVNEGFKTIGEAGGDVLGKGVDATGSYKITLNRDRIPDSQTAIEGAIHEIGGHAKTMSIAPEQLGNPKSYSKTVSEWFPYLTKLIEKNKQLGDEILELNEKGKFLSQFKNSSDVELYTEANKSWDLFDQLLNDVKRFKYVTSSQERYARGYTGQLYEKLYGPSTKTLNIKQLEDYYTPESVEKFKKALLGITPITIGIGATTNE